MSKTKLIEELTEAQKAQIPIYVERYKAIALDTTTTDKEKAQHFLSEAYKYAQEKDLTPKAGPLEFLWVDSPTQGMVAAAQAAAGREKVTREELREQINFASFGSFEAYWVVMYAFIAEQLPVEKDNLIDIVKGIITHCGVYWTFESLVIICPKPSEIHMKDGKLHNTTGLALAYANGEGIIAIDGIRKNSLMEAVFAERNDGKAS